MTARIMAIRNFSHDTELITLRAMEDGDDDEEEESM